MIPHVCITGMTRYREDINPDKLVWEPSLLPRACIPQTILDSWHKYLVENHIPYVNVGFGGHLDRDAERYWFNAMIRGKAMRLKNTLGLMVGQIYRQLYAESPVITVARGQVVVGGFGVVNLRVMGDPHLHSLTALQQDYLYSNILAEQAYADREATCDPKSTELWATMRKWFDERRKAS